MDGIVVDRNVNLDELSGFQDESENDETLMKTEGDEETITLKKNTLRAKMNSIAMFTAKLSTGGSMGLNEDEDISVGNEEEQAVI
jgi:hypothetical protein